VIVCRILKQMASMSYEIANNDDFDCRASVDVEECWRSSL
jgi:hypothetical protein